MKYSISWIPLQKSILPRGIVLRNVETGEYRYYYEHEINTVFEKTHLLCTIADLITNQGKVETFDIVEQCTQECLNTKWRFKLITKVIFLLHY